MKAIDVYGVIFLSIGLSLLGAILFNTYVYSYVDMKLTWGIDLISISCFLGGAGFWILNIKYTISFKEDPDYENSDLDTIHTKLAIAASTIAISHLFLVFVIMNLSSPLRNYTKARAVVLFLMICFFGINFIRNLFNRYTH